MRTLAAAMMVLLACASAGAVSWEQEAKLLPFDGATTDYFGTSVSVSGATALVGAYAKNNWSGAAYVYQNVGGVWTQSAKLLPSDIAAYDQFGGAVSVSGSTALVGAYLDDDLGTDSGSAYLFQNVGGVWAQSAKFTPSGGVTRDQFGYSVSIDGTAAVIGANRVGNYTGSAYLFESVGGAWTQTAKLTASDGQTGDMFGYSVSVSGATAIVGARYHPDLGSGSGAAYVFEKVGGVWTQTAKLLASDGALGDHFGEDVSVSGSIAVVGALFKDDCGTVSGSAYIFEKVGGVWTQTAKILPSDSAAYDTFGNSVAVSGSTVVVGAERRDNYTGAVFVFEKIGGIWTEVSEIRPADGAEYDSFGCAVGLSGSTALVGALGDDDCGSASGSAYIFEQASLLAGDANGDGKIDGGDLALWQQHYDPLGLNAGDCWAWGDWNSDHKIDGGDLAIWQQNYAPLGYTALGSPLDTAAVPEPATLTFVATGLLGAFGFARRRRR